jgi:hypothetical protein
MTEAVVNNQPETLLWRLMTEAVVNNQPETVVAAKTAIVEKSASKDGAFHSGLCQQPIQRRLPTTHERRTIVNPLPLGGPLLWIIDNKKA